MKAMVIDPGTSAIRIGFAGEQQPRIIGNTSNPNSPPSNTVFDNVVEYRGKINWSNFTELLNHVLFEKFKVDPYEYCILIAESLFPNNNDTQIAREILFETFGVARVANADFGLLSVIASDHSSGLIVDIGESITSIFPLYEGLTVRRAGTRSSMCSRLISEYLDNLLTTKNNTFNVDLKHQVLREILEHHCYVQQKTSDIVKQIEYNKEGHHITLGHELYQAPEILFDPKLCGSDDWSIIEAISSTLNNLDIEVRSILVPNIIVTGGTSLIPGLIDRMRIEINRQNRELLAHLKMNGSELGIRGLIDPLNSVWHGGSKLASNSLFQQYFTVEKKEYLSERDGVMDPESKFYNKDIYWAKVMDQVTIS